MKELPPLPTRVGKSLWRGYYHFGWDVAEELAGQETLTGLIALAVTGRRLSDEECAVLDDIAGALTVCDPRIWPYKLIRVVTSYGNCLAGLAAGNLCISQARLGNWTTGHAAQLLQEMDDVLGHHCHDPQRLAVELANVLEEKKWLFGFGVPYRPLDERVVTLRRCMEKRGRNELHYFRLFEALTQAMRSLRNVDPNIGLCVAAVLLDLGIKQQDISPLCSAVGQNAYLTNAVEGAAQAPEVLRQIPDDFVSYVGKGPRSSPRSKRER